MPFLLSLLALLLLKGPYNSISLFVSKTKNAAHSSHVDRGELQYSQLLQIAPLRSSNIKNFDDSIVTFAGVRLHEPLVSSLQNMGVKSPTAIQAAAISPLTTGLSAIVHAETGSGKTIAYILPLLKRLLATPNEQINSIKSLIIVPTKELAVQVAADIALLLGLSTSDDNDKWIHLCLTTNRQGLDKVIAPVVIGTPVKLVSAMRLSSSSTFRSISYIVLDEVDRLLSVAGRYATHEEKQKAAEETNPIETILSNILRLRGSADDKQLVQIVAVSATIGRPMRRELCRIVSGGETFEGFPIIRGKQPDDVGESSVNSNMQTQLFEHEGNQQSNSPSRFVSVPKSIKHVCVLVDTKTDDLTGKIVHVKSYWMSEELKAVNRALLFVPQSTDVKGTVGMLKFWGVLGCVDLQAALGLTAVKPTGIGLKLGKSRMGSKFDDFGDGDSFQGDYDGQNVLISLQNSSITSQSSNLIQLAKQNRLGAASRLTVAESSHQPNSQATAAKQSIENDQSSAVNRKRLSLKRRGSKSSDEGEASPTIANGGVLDRELYVAPVSGTRGLHLQDIDCVFITHVPRTMDEYLHMAGRTGRAGNKRSNGAVYSFVNYDELKRIQAWQTPLGIKLDIEFS